MTDADRRATATGPRDRNSRPWRNRNSRPWNRNSRARRSLAVGLFAALFLTAGCGAVGDGAPSRDPYDVEPTATETPTPTADPAEATGASETVADGDAPEDPAKSGTAVADGDRPRSSGRAVATDLRDQRRWLSEIGSYTITVVVNDTFGDRTVDARRVLRVDHGRYYSRSVVVRPGGTSVAAVYADASATYRRSSGPGRSTRYAVGGGWNGRPPLNGTLARVGDGPVGQVTWDDLERAGTQALGDRRFARYVAGGRRVVDTPAGVDEVTDFRATVLVDRRGLVRLLTVRIEGRVAGGREYRRRFRYAVTDLATTTVDRPAWVRAAGNGSSDAVGGNESGAAGRNGPSDAESPDAGDTPVDWNESARSLSAVAAAVSGSPRQRPVSRTVRADPVARRGVRPRESPSRRPVAGSTLLSAGWRSLRQDRPGLSTP